MFPTITDNVYISSTSITQGTIHKYSKNKNTAYYTLFSWNYKNCGFGFEHFFHQENHISNPCVVQQLF